MRRVVNLLHIWLIFHAPSRLLPTHFGRSLASGYTEVFGTILWKVISSTTACVSTVYRRAQPSIELHRLTFTANINKADTALESQLHFFCFCLFNRFLFPIFRFFLIRFALFTFFFVFFYGFCTFLRDGVSHGRAGQRWRIRPH